MLCQNVIIFGGPIVILKQASQDFFFDLTASVFRSWLTQGTVTLSMLSCAFLTLFKGGLKDPKSTHSWRAGSSVILNFLDYTTLCGDTYVGVTIYTNDILLLAPNILQVFVFGLNGLPLSKIVHFKLYRQRP